MRGQPDDINRDCASWAQAMADKFREERESGREPTVEAVVYLERFDPAHAHDSYGTRQVEVTVEIRDGDPADGEVTWACWMDTHERVDLTDAEAEKAIERALVDYA